MRTVVGAIIDHPDHQLTGGIGGVETEAEIRGEVRRQLASEVDYVKLNLGVSLPLLAAAVDEAHAGGGERRTARYRDGPVGSRTPRLSGGGESDAGHDRIPVLGRRTRTQGVTRTGLRAGTVEERRVADLVVLRADPLDDIRNIRTIDLVITKGRPFEPGALIP